MAEIVMMATVHERGVASRWRIDSAGTSGYHDGEGPDSRSAKTCKRLLGDRMPDIRHVKSRKLRASDYTEFDLILCMDESNLADVCRHSAACSTCCMIGRLLL
jgi:protein-tyrosine-phosphatase